MVLMWYLSAPSQAKLVILSRTLVEHLDAEGTFGHSGLTCLRTCYVKPSASFSDELSRWCDAMLFRKSKGFELWVLDPIQVGSTSCQTLTKHRRPFSSTPTVFIAIMSPNVTDVLCLNLPKVMQTLCVVDGMHSVRAFVMEAVGVRGWHQKYR